MVKEATLRDAAKLFDSLFDGIYYVDLERRITFWNKAAQRITGYSAAEIRGQCCADNLLRHIDSNGHELCLDGCPLAAVMLDGKTRSAQVYLHHKDGHRVPVTVRAFPLEDESGKIIGAVEIFSDNIRLDEIRREMDRLKHDAFTDTLTGLANRRYGEMALETRFFEMQRHQTPFGALFIDIDHFKRVNDDHGHHIGDEVLKMVGRTVTNMLRSQDLICRWGGEEFVVILPLLDFEHLVEVAERIRTFIERSYIMLDSGKLTVTVSIGGTLGREDDSSEGLLGRADHLMYRSKEAGRNRVTIE
jgi:diguanylate cyclase (GGDEF)-like protein/PAS domain S-box-containing protein